MNRTDKGSKTNSAADPREPAELPAHGDHPSLEGVHGSVSVPHHASGFWQQWKAFVGPASLISVG
jgi:hypothetical protein